MRCTKCSEEIILVGTKFCPKCGAKIIAPAKTPNIQETFSDVRKISLKVGNRITVNPSSTPETTITIDAPEEIKSDLKIEMTNGVLSVKQSSTKIGGMNIVSNGGSISISGGSCSNVVIGGNSGIVVNGQRITSSGAVGEVVINITTPLGVDLDVDTSGGVDISLGDLKNKVKLDTHGGCVLRAKCLVAFKADTSGGLTATIDSFAGGNCTLDTSGSCHLTISSGTVEELNIDASGGTFLDVMAEVEEANLDVSGSLSGRLRANSVDKDVCGSDRLSIVR
jgi:hypothetical protein